jgi:hypothetical protein
MQGKRPPAIHGRGRAAHGVSSRTARRILLASGVRLLSSGDRRDYAWKSHVDALQAAVDTSRWLKEAR